MKFKGINYKNKLGIMQDKPLPSELTFEDKGKLFILVQNMDKQNRLAKNGKPFTMLQLQNILEIKNAKTVNLYIDKLKQLNMIKSTKPNKNGNIYLLINPAYFFKSMKTNAMLYHYFPDDLSPYLDKLQKKYLELLYLEEIKNEVL